MDVSKLPNLPDSVEFNMMGLPYIEVSDGFPKLVFKDTQKLTNAPVSDTDKVYNSMTSGLRKSLADRLIDEHVRRGNLSVQHGASLKETHLVTNDYKKVEDNIQFTLEQRLKGRV
jgi:phosphosulfolactate synthase (CoM biosynthesis protein A)